MSTAPQQLMSVVSADDYPPPPVPASIVGIPKDGLRIRLETNGSVLSLRGRADPLLLYVVYGAALTFAFIGTVAVSPTYGVAGAVLFSLLFAPMLLFTSLGAIRLRVTCVIDRVNQVVRLRERSYVGQHDTEWPLERLVRIVVAPRPATHWALGGDRWDLYLDFGDVAYLVAVSADQAWLARLAHQVGRFVGLQSETVPPVAGTPPGPRTWLGEALLFIVPLAATPGLVALATRDRAPESQLATIAMSALVVCQASALVAFAARRGRARGG